MPKELIKREVRDKKSPEELFSNRVNRFIKKSHILLNKIESPSVEVYVASILDILSYYNIDNSDKVSKVLLESIKEFKDFKKISLQKIKEAKGNKADLQIKEATDLAGGGDGKQFSSLIKSLDTNVYTKTKDFNIATNIVKSIETFVNTDQVLKSIIAKQKRQNKKENLKLAGAGILTALTGSAIPALMPSMFRAGKQKFKEFRQTSGKGKVLMGLQGASLGTGALLGSSLGMMGASYLGQKSGAELQKIRNINDTIKNVNKNIKTADQGEFSVDNMINSGSSTRSRSIRASKKSLDPALGILLKHLEPGGGQLSRSLSSQGYTLHAKGGMFETNGPMAIGKDVFGEAGPEKLKAIGTDGDPAANELKTTNKLLKELIDVNKESTTLQKDIAEDSAEARNREGLNRKSSVVEKTSSLFGLGKQEDDPKKENKGGLLSRLKEQGLSRVGNALSKMKFPGAKLLGGAAGMMSDATPVYVVNASEMGGGGGLDIPSGKGKLGRLGKLGRFGGGIGLGTAAAGAAAAYGLHGTYKAVTEGRSQQNDIARKIGLVKSKEDIESGKDSRSNLNPLKWAGMGIDNLASGAASVANWASGNKPTKSIKERKDNKVQEVVVKEDKSKQTAEQLKLAKTATIFQKDTSKMNENMAVKADENKTLMEKMTSIWSDPSKSLLSKISGSVSSGYSSAKEAVRKVFRPKSEYDISKLKDGVGSVAAKYESGGAGAGTISSGKGDFGGKSYGTHQFTGGALQDFIKTSSHAKEFEGLKKGTPEFDAAWKNAAKDPNFGKEQHNQIMKTHAAPQMDKLKKLGLNTDSKALQEMAFSTGVQYGPGSEVIEQAIKASGKDPSKLSTKEIIQIVQDYKAATVGKKFKSSSSAVQQSVARRHGVNEKADLMKIAEAEANGTLPIVASTKGKEGSIKNIKNNSTQGSTGTNLKNKEVAIDAANNAQYAKGTQRAISNINIGGSAPQQKQPSPTIYTGDQISFATRLAKAY